MNTRLYDLLASLARANQILDAGGEETEECRIDDLFVTTQNARQNNAAVSDGSTASYYELPPDTTQLQDLISHRDMNAQIGEIFRACYRYGMASHSDRLRDAKKILFYAQAEVSRLEKLDD